MPGLGFGLAGGADSRVAVFAHLPLVVAHRPGSDDGSSLSASAGGAFGTRV